MASNKFKFSNRRIADLKPPKDRAEWHYDSETPGFAVTVSPRGKSVFYYVGRINGRVCRIRVGEFPGVSVDDARKSVRGHLGDVARGKSISERRKAGRATVDDLFEHYLAVHAKPTKRTWKRDEKEYERLIKPEFGTTPLVQVRRAEVEVLIARIQEADGRGPARKARALLSKMFEIGIDSEWCPSNPVRGTRRPDFDERQRSLKADELGAFLQAVDQLESETARTFFLLALFTGARRSNVCSMRWSDLDLSVGLWHLPASRLKGKKPQVIPLGEAALEIIKRRQNNGSPWVLPGRGRAGHYTDVKDAWRRVLKLSGLKDLRVHDLRRSLGAWAQKTGANLKSISQTLGHSDVRVTAKFYTPMEVEQVRSTTDNAVQAMRKAGGL